MQIIYYILIGLFAGGFGGLLGLGGGTIIIPALVYLMGFTQHQAQGTSLVLAVLPIGLLAAWFYYAQGNVDLKAGIYIAFGFFFGSFIGAKLAHLINDEFLKKIFALYLIIIGIKMLWGK